MPIPKKVENYLNKTNKAFEAVSHKTVYTAYDLAQTMKKNLSDIAKALVVKTDKEYKIAVIPASLRLNMKKLKKLLKTKKLSFPDEKVMAKIFKVKPGALSAFGTLHKVQTVVDKSLLKTKEVILQAGSFTDSVRMKARDFVEAEKALIGSFTENGGYKLQKNKAKVKKPMRKKKS